MRGRTPWRCWRSLIPLLLLAPLVPAFGDDAESVDYNRDVRPILAANCYACHGPDAAQRKAGLRFDEREGALATLRRGRRAIVPSEPERSEMIRRVSASDEEERMPPPETGKRLTPAEIEVLRRWIEQGAAWSRHWAYVTPERPPLPEVRDRAWSRTAVDRFVLARLEREGLEPSPDADRVTLIRRLSLDLLGLPPEPGEIDAFLADEADDAYARMIERILGSPHYGERMAIYWLDLVRFADTRGYHSDNPRNVSPYRDYVIDAFNENRPFDQFTVEQLAGDLLPDASIWQRVASCYNKLNQTTEEGGAQAREYEAKNSSDRVRNVSVVWMGATLGCAECHEHKFDPYEADDFYEMAAFFADIQESAIMDRDQGIPVPTRELENELAALDARIAAMKLELERPQAGLAAAIASDQAEWERSVDRSPSPRLGAWHSIGPFRAATGAEAFTTAYAPEREIDLAAAPDGLRWRERADWKDGAVHALEGENSATYLFRTIDVDSDATLDVSLGSDDGIRVWINDELVLSKEVYRGVAPDQERVTLPLRAGANRLLMKIVNGGGAHGFYFRPLAGPELPGEVRAAIAVPAADRTDDQRGVIAAHYRSIAPRLAPSRAELADLEKRRADVEKSFRRCLVSVSGPPRTVRVLPRGNWMDTSGKVVEPAIPSFLGELDTGDRRATRLDLARWLVAPDNPLTARVFVNRLWMLFFGSGISKRLDDLGAMGEPPVHPKLLDWLAVEFVESGWDVKRMVRQMVLSSTYRQSSVPTAEALRRDPYNRLLARQSRWRLDAEMVRDGALAISGLLSRKMGGPSVKPYQPAGYWVHLNFPKRKWVADKGEDAFRRGLYTWWQRSFLHPGMIAFDAPSREECTAERPRSNIPQQALVLLNDPTYVEAARVFALQIVEGDGTDDRERIRRAFRRATSRAPRDDEVDVLLDLLEAHRESYASDPQAAAALLGVGATPAPASVQAARLAAWTSVARAILNLHETVTRN